MESTRKNALLAGEKTYFTGKPCVHGHVAPRRIDGYCVECRKIHESVYMRDYLKNYNYTRNDDRYQYFKEYDKNRDKLKISARKKLNIAVRSGKIERQCCLKCGKADAHAHHYDYEKPLDIIWLCPFHHREIHSTK